MKETYLDSDPAEEGARKLSDAATQAMTEGPRLIAQIKGILDMKPEGTDEAGQRFTAAHAAVQTALDGIGDLLEQIQDMAENMMKGIQGTITDDQLAALLVNAPELQDIPEPKFPF